MPRGWCDYGGGVDGKNILLWSIICIEKKKISKEDQSSLGDATKKKMAESLTQKNNKNEGEKYRSQPGGRWQREKKYLGGFPFHLSIK